MCPRCASPDMAFVLILMFCLCHLVRGASMTFYKPNKQHFDITFDGDQAMQIPDVQSFSNGKKAWQKTVNFASSENVEPECEKCNDVEELLEDEEFTEIIREVRVNLLKAKMLSLLGYEKPPNVTGFPKIPDIVTDGLKYTMNYYQTDQTIKQEKTEVFRAITRAKCPPSSDEHSICFAFSSSRHGIGKSVQDDLSSAAPSRKDLNSLSNCNDRTYNITLYINLNMTRDDSVYHLSVFKVTVPGTHTYNATKAPLRLLLGQREIQKSDEGWVMILLEIPVMNSDLCENSSGQLNLLEKHSLANENTSNDSHRHLKYQLTEHDLILEISCPLCPPEMLRRHEKMLQPLLTVETLTRQKSGRSRREIRDCSSRGKGDKRCCRDKMRLSFENIGWGDWIIQPKEFDFFFCRGSCMEPSLKDVFDADNNYIGLLNRLVLDPKLNRQLRSALAPCCSVADAEPLAILHYNSANSVVVDFLPEMIVTECACQG